jgi:hypothetical protein
VIRGANGFLGGSFAPPASGRSPWPPTWINTSCYSGDPPPCGQTREGLPGDERICRAAGGGRVAPMWTRNKARVNVPIRGGEPL